MTKLLFAYAIAFIMILSTSALPMPAVTDTFSEPFNVPMASTRSDNLQYNNVPLDESPHFQKRFMGSVFGKKKAPKLQLSQQNEDGTITPIDLTGQAPAEEQKNADKTPSSQKLVQQPNEVQGQQYQPPYQNGPYNPYQQSQYQGMQYPAPYNPTA